MKRSFEDVWSETTKNWSDDDFASQEKVSTAFKLEAERIRIARLLRQRQSELKLSQKTVAALSGIQEADLSRFYNGKANFTLTTQLKLFSVLGLELTLTPIGQTAGGKTRAKKAQTQSIIA